MESILKENPVLESAGVTLNDFGFSRSTNLFIDGKRPSKFPLVGGALKCSGCGRWHNVPEKVMHAVRCPFPQQ